LQHKYRNKILQITLFSPEVEKSLKWQTFLETELGRLYQCIPFEELVKHFPESSEKGKKSLMGVRGGLGLQFLKSYLDLSDAKLIERLNTDWCLQLFCGVNFGLHTKIKDKDYVGRWRRMIAADLDIETMQGTLVHSWKEDISDQQACLMDATCYESFVRFPTDAKLLWESCEWVFESMFRICKNHKISKPRSKYKEKQKRYSLYSRLRKKGYKRTQKIKKQLLHLLEKGLGQLGEIVVKTRCEIGMTDKFRERLGVITQVLEQQKEIYKKGQTAGANRIVSLAKPYLRPIIRGKETKRVEFGVKAHMFEIGGVCLIEHLSFNAFNECTRLKSTVRLQQKYTGKKVTMLGADKIYPTRKNRAWCKENEILTNFVPLGRRSSKKEDKKSSISVARKALDKERSTVLEGTFGNQKMHYSLRIIRAKTAKTELLWLAFGVWTAAAMKIANIRAKKESPPVDSTLKAA
jgi:hypothetical protein